MRRQIVVFLLSLLLIGCGSKAVDYPFTSVSFENVSFEDGLLGRYVSTVRENTIPFAFKKCEETGRISNFAKAGGLMEGDFVGRRYDDSDVFKVVEAASYSLAACYDEALDNYLDSLIVLIAAAQEPDGYLYTIRTAPGENKDKGMGPERWSKIATSHELYNVGHLYEAAVAHFNATGKRSLLDVAIKNADLLYDTFYNTGRKIVPGHEEIELALVRLFRSTGEKRYLSLARFFLECRGESGNEYCQDHLPVTEQREAVGHAVRAAYLYMAMTDIAAITGDDAYRQAVDSLWADVTGRKMYLTGGIGSERNGERFGPPYSLPNADAYCETCAAIANCMWNYRMFCLYGDGKYFDVFERALYNNVLDGISEDGMLFFYANPLERNPDNLDGSGPGNNYLYRARRREWYSTSCCPTNLARFITSLPGYTYSVKGRSIYVNLYERGSASFSYDGATVAIRQVTDYPSDGGVSVILEKAPSARSDIRLRIPLWSRGVPVPGGLYRYVSGNDGIIRISVNGRGAEYSIENGYAVVTHRWKDGDRIDLSLPMSFHRVKAADAVEADEGKVAYERGPIVYCMEMEDTTSVDIRQIQEPYDVSSLIPYYSHAEGPVSQMAVFLNENPSAGRTFYVSSDGDDDADGLSAENSWKSLDRVNSAVLAPGDSILFHCDDIFRGNLVARGGTEAAPVYYGSYGTGQKPVLEPSWEAGSVTDWTAEGNGLWKCVVGATKDIGNIIFNHGDAGCAARQDNLADCVGKDLAYAWVAPEHAVYMAGDANPAQRFSSIELAENKPIVIIDGCRNVCISGLWLRYGAGHGIRVNEAGNISVRDTDISWIGGGALYVDSLGNGVRYGNGIELWGQVDNVLVQGCRVWECWDAGLTNQTKGKRNLQKDIAWSGNEVWNCEYSYEYWNQGTGDGACTENVIFNNNYCHDAGKGWGHSQRWNPNAAHLMLYDNMVPTKGFTIMGNRFENTENCGIRLFGAWYRDIEMKDNLWLIPEGYILRYHGRPTRNLQYKYPDRLDWIHDDNEAEIQSQTVEEPILLGHGSKAVRSMSRMFGFE